ncbi:MAG: transcription antitermination factor NusB [Chthonomonadales bacterium]
MIQARRDGRELALRALYQADVGKQPLDEVLEGVCEQVLQSLAQPIGQASMEGSASLKRTALARTENLSVNSKRQIKTIATLSATVLRHLSTEVRGAIKTALVAQNEAPRVELQSRLNSLHAEFEHEISKLQARQSYHPDILKVLADIAHEKAILIQADCAKLLPLALETSTFMTMLIQGTLSHRRELDLKIAPLSEGWQLDRQAAVDRNIMRIAAFEILFVDDIPLAASINEAVELAKKYSTAESGKFVNGILGSIGRAHTPKNSSKSGEANG